MNGGDDDSRGTSVINGIDDGKSGDGREAMNIPKCEPT